MNATATLPDTASHDTYRPLGMSARVRLNAAACLPERFPDNECSRCVPACPLALLESSSGAPRLAELHADRCIGCGQCVAACPTAALQTDGLALPGTCPTDAATLFIDCWRVPLMESPHGAWRIPCLGGITTGWLLAMFDRVATQGERPIRLLDRGSCATCPAGADLSASHAALKETRALLTACGVPDTVLPAATFLPVHQKLAPAIPTSADALGLNRRNFFHSLMGGIARAADDIQLKSASTGAATFRQDAAPIERLRITTALSRIAARHGSSMPARTLPQLSVTDCDAHGVCASVCPTGALRWHEAGCTGELRFHAALCVACGQCAHTCPVQAIRLSLGGGQEEIETLARWQARECLNCGESFFGAEADLCPDCLKRSSLQQDMAALFRPSA